MHGAEERSEALMAVAETRGRRGSAATGDGEAGGGVVRREGRELMVSVTSDSGHRGVLRRELALVFLEEERVMQQ